MLGVSHLALVLALMLQHRCQASTLVLAQPLNLLMHCDGAWNDNHAPDFKAM